MNTLLRYLAALGLLAGAAAASASLPHPVHAALPEGSAIVASGEATARWLGLRLYDARLWRHPDADDPLEAPLVMELRYARAFGAARLVQVTLDEMRRLGRADAPQRWRETLSGIFPDVAAGDRLIALHLPGQGAVFWQRDDGRLTRLGEVPDPDFSRTFFGIWLADDTRAPELREALLGGLP